MDQHWGVQLKKAISKRGYNKFTSLAAAMDVSESTISRWAAGESIGIENAIKLCDEMDISMDWLFRSAEGLEAVPSDTPVGEKLAERWQKCETNIRNKPANA
jgi:transcriptional regulator with XRE-family HTH domain